MVNLDQKTRRQFSQVYHIVKYQHHLHHHDPQKKACSSTRSIEEDQLSKFLSSDKVTFTSLKANLVKNQRESLVHLSCFIIEDALYVQSQQYLNGLPLFLVKIFKDLNFETYHCGINCTISTLSKNRVMTVHAWSDFEEIIRYLKKTWKLIIKRAFFRSILVQWHLQLGRERIVKN